MRVTSAGVARRSAIAAKCQSIERRLNGRYYTPAWLAEEMLAGCLASWRESHTHGSTPQILDPSCGEGVFLLAAFDRICRERSLDEPADWPLRLAIVRDCLFGVDTDPAAIDTLRAELGNRIAAPVEDSSAIDECLQQNIRCGDALAGDDLNRCAEAASRRGPQGRSSEPGFDLVIGNPPYLRELGARELFDRIARSPLGRWRQARMDLWHYFVHRGLDFLRDGGLLSYVVNEYWTASSGASKLIGRLRDETSFEEIRLLGDQPIFDGVAGRHMTFRLRKLASDGAIGPLFRSLPSRVQSTEAVERLPCRVLDADGCFELPHEALFAHGRLLIARPRVSSHTTSRGLVLGDVFLVRQGMAENPPVVTRRQAEELRALTATATDSPPRAGDGVFVLTPGEVESLGLSNDEKALLRPYFQAVDIGRYSPPGVPERFVFYLTRSTAPDIAAFPGIARHLGRFRPLLERRREVGRGRIEWWHLHWPREERIFTERRILAPQMGRAPRFALACEPTYVGFAVNLILFDAALKGEGRLCGLPLAALCGLLNSRRAADWFQRHAKQRGINLDISGTTLRRFPLPIPSAERSSALERLVERRQSLERSNGARTADALDDAIEQLVDEWYESA